MNIINLYIYRVSALVPVFFLFSFAWYIHYKTLFFPILFSLIGIIFVLLFCISFKYARGHIASISIDPINITPTGNWPVIYLISYIVSSVTIVFLWDNPWVSLIGIIFFTLVIPALTSKIPHFFLSITGYHFFTVNTSNGINDSILISKRQFRDKNQLRSVKRLFEYLLYDDRT
jgi:hypothetical protein